MKVKEFFKSTAFKSVVVLFVICFVCVALLGILNDVLYVSEDEIFSRNMSKIYDKPGVSFKKSGNLDSTYANGANGTVLSVTDILQSGEVIGAVIESKGNGGFKGGTVTCYVIVTVEGKIDGVSIKEADASQTFVGNITQKYLSNTYVGNDISEEIVPDAVKFAGTTWSSAAVTNAVNTASTYALNALKFGKNPANDAKDALVAMLAGSEYAALEWVNISASSVSFLGDDKNVVSYAFKSTTTDSTAVLGLEYKVGDTAHYVVINPLLGASGDTSAVLISSVDIPAEIVALASKFNFSVDKATTRFSLEVKGEAVEYVVTVPGLSEAPGNTFTISVEDGKITAISAGKPLTQDWGEPTIALADLVGQDISYFATPPKTGATYSNTVIYNACKLALEHYNANFAE